MAKCPKCGVEVECGAKFCMECGEAIPQTKECPKCHAVWPLNAKFCQECGYNFNAVAAGSGGAGVPLMGDKNVIAGDVNNSVSMSNSNNTTNNTVNNTTNNTTNNVSNTTHNVSNVTNNTQVTHNNTILQQETEMDRAAKQAQIDKLRLEKERQAQEAALEQEAQRLKIEQLRLEKEQQERELARKNEIEAERLKVEKLRQAAELEKEKLRMESARESIESPFSKKTFRKIGLWGGFFGLQYAYVRRWILFGASLACMAGMMAFGKHSAPDAANSAEKRAEPESVKAEKSIQSSTRRENESSDKMDPVTMIFGLPLIILWFGGTFFITTDAKGRRLV
mgnify:CR=1 FL=1